jgi:hypothetical protein
MNIETPTDKDSAPQTNDFFAEALARGHLNEGIPHIVYNLLSRDKSSIDSMEQIKKDAIYVDANNDQEHPHGPNVFEVGLHFISCTDERNKFSRGYKNCVGLIVVGRSKTTGKEISFMTHQDSSYGDQKEDRSDFDAVLNKSLVNILNDTEQGSIDAVVFGGSVPEINDYNRVIRKISQELTERLGFEPIILTGPGGSIGDGLEPKVAPTTEAYFDTQKRIVYILRSQVPDKNRDKPYYSSRTTK